MRTVLSGARRERLPRCASACCRGASVMSRMSRESGDVGLPDAAAGRRDDHDLERRRRATSNRSVAAALPRARRPSAGCAPVAAPRSARSAARRAAADVASTASASSREHARRTRRGRRTRSAKTNSWSDTRAILQRKAIEQHARALRSRRRSAPSAASSDSNARSSRSRCTKPTRIGGAVQIAVEVEDVRLDRRAARVVDGRPRRRCW